MKGNEVRLRNIRLNWRPMKPAEEKMDGLVGEVERMRPMRSHPRWMAESVPAMLREPILDVDATVMWNIEDVMFRCWIEKE